VQTVFLRSRPVSWYAICAPLLCCCLSGQLLSQDTPLPPPYRNPGPATRLPGTTLPPAPEELSPRARRIQKLSSVPILSEAEYTRLLAQRAANAVPPARTIAAIEAAALSNAPGALGVAGKVERDVQIEGDVFLVAQDTSLTSSGEVESKRFYVSAVPLSGRVSWAARESALLFSDTPEDSAKPTASSLQGCAPLAGRRGLPPASCSIWSRPPAR
jgi:hypothetical protein